jgi:hypothetical protein
LKYSVSSTPPDGFGGLVVSMLASGSRVREFEPLNFFDMKKSSACLPSEGKQNNRAHVPTLGHVKHPRFCCELRAAGYSLFLFLPSLIEVSRAGRCGVPLEMTEGNYSNVGHRGPLHKGLGAMNPCDLYPLQENFLSLCLLDI